MLARARGVGSPLFCALCVSVLVLCDLPRLHSWFSQLHWFIYISLFPLSLWLCWPSKGLCLFELKIVKAFTLFFFFALHQGLHYIWATELLHCYCYLRELRWKMEDFWAGALWALRIWLYLIVFLIMIPAMFGFSLGISETYMTILVKTLEVVSFTLYSQLLPVLQIL